MGHIKLMLLVHLCLHDMFYKMPIPGVGVLARHMPPATPLSGLLLPFPWMYGQFTRHSPNTAIPKHPHHPDAVWFGIQELVSIAPLLPSSIDSLLACRVSVLEGGYPAWKALSLPVDAAAAADEDIAAPAAAARSPPSAPAKYTAKFDASKVPARAYCCCFLPHLVASCLCKLSGAGGAARAAGHCTALLFVRPQPGFVLSSFFTHSITVGLDAKHVCQLKCAG